MLSWQKHLEYCLQQGKKRKKNEEETAKQTVNLQHGGQAGRALADLERTLLPGAAVQKLLLKLMERR